MKKHNDTLQTLLSELDVLSLLKAFDLAVDPIMLTTTNWEEGIKFLYVNAAFTRETGYTNEEIFGKSPKILQGEKTDKKVLEKLKKDLQAGKNFSAQNINYTKEQLEYIVRWNISPLLNAAGELMAYISFQKIITKLVAMQNENFLLHSVVKKAPGMILVTDTLANIVYANDAFCRNMGYMESELLGQNARVLKSGKQNKNFYKNMWDSLLKNGSFEDVFLNKKKDGTLFYDKKKINSIKDTQGNVSNYFSVSYDVTKERRNEERMRDEIYMDALTKLSNRKKYDLALDEYMSAFDKNAAAFSLILFDIDFFKNVNDTYGHDKGDFILKESARLVRSLMVQQKDTLYRWGGEEFVILTNRAIDDANNLAKIVRVLIKEHDFDGVKITLSFGLGEMQAGLDKESFFKRVDQALYEAKKSGRDKIVLAKE
ncbi:MAG: diguanylate cyclase [Sulfurimonas sp.]|nr:diguanylate cyclase [Sulfurimonas sp.]